MDTKYIKFTELDLGSFKDIKSITIGENIDGHGSDIFFEFIDGNGEGYSLQVNWVERDSQPCVFESGERIA